MLTLVLFSSGISQILADGPNAWTATNVNLRSGPGTKYPQIGALAPSTALILEGRNKDTSWVLVHTEDNATRGWAKTTLLEISKSLSLYSLPITDVDVQGNAAEVKPDTTDPNKLPAVNVNTNLTTPIVPAISGGVRSTIRSIYALGQNLGNHSRVFAKVGDCLTDHWAFLNVFGGTDHNLGDYGYLQDVIDYYNVPTRDGVDNSFHETSIAAYNGFNSNAVLDPQWAQALHPDLCRVDESPLRCEYRVTKPAVAIIMFGTADVLTMTPQQFNVYLRFIVKDTTDRGIVPLLSTFPANANEPDRSRQINQVIINLAKEKYLPIMNLDAALDSLPNHGLEGDGIHLTVPPNGASGYFTPDNMQFGYTMRNLVTLQALEAVWKSLPH